MQPVQSLDAAHPPHDQMMVHMRAIPLQKLAHGRSSLYAPPWYSTCVRCKMKKSLVTILLNACLFPAVAAHAQDGDIVVTPAAPAAGDVAESEDDDGVPPPPETLPNLPPPGGPRQ